MSLLKQFDAGEEVENSTVVESATDTVTATDEVTETNDDETVSI